MLHKEANSLLTKTKHWEKVTQRWPLRISCQEILEFIILVFVYIYQAVDIEVPQVHFLFDLQEVYGHF